ncbi:hypothetical protein COLO4_10894 [Corchorus olitorius]|uniref:Uncharacterized protein n=1 Tax=Corchorus olitorius TaxID=93759 RepID=A0A1R3K6J9_9ROSI|nr:hypothetical protein COLO4_10894 [Corchorus olitorius]
METFPSGIFRLTIVPKNEDLSQCLTLPFDHAAFQNIHWLLSDHTIGVNDGEL